MKRAGCQEKGAGGSTLLNRALEADHWVSPVPPILAFFASDCVIHCSYRVSSCGHGLGLHRVI